MVRANGIFENDSLDEGVRRQLGSILRVVQEASQKQGATGQGGS